MLGLHTANLIDFMQYAGAASTLCLGTLCVTILNLAYRNLVDPVTCQPSH